MKKPDDTESRSEWYKYGEKLEHVFLEHIAPSLSLPISLNQDKEHDPTAIDMIYRNKFESDLKTQNTPFFTSKRYSVPPQYAVTFNHKDYERYKRLYPFSIIFFWVHWTTLNWKDIKVKPMNAVYKVPFWKLVRDIESGSVKLHTYDRRKDDGRPNAKDSYVLDIRHYTKIAEVKK